MSCFRPSAFKPARMSDSAFCVAACWQTVQLIEPWPRTGLLRVWELQWRAPSKKGRSSTNQRPHRLTCAQASHYNAISQVSGAAPGLP